MAKAKFPGRPSKIHSRKRVLSSDLINCINFDGFRAAEDAYCRLSVFDFLFPEENEGPSFHGFSPHDVEDARRNLAGYRKSRDSLSSTAGVKVERESESKKVARSKKLVSNGSKDVVRKPNPGTSTLEPKEGKKPSGGKLPVAGSQAVSGKFVLPSRSAHSSRVIKPNKRFLENQSPDRASKRGRDDGDEVEKENSLASFTAEDVVLTSAAESPTKDKTSSPVKFVLQKPKLKITTEPYSLVEGPFSSQSSPPSERLKGQNMPPTKVICGVCGSMWYYKHVKQARKYGIFSCNPCKKFIMRALKAHENKSISVYACASSTGSCVIRQSTLGSCIPFSTDKQPDNPDSSSRCQACWLNLCLRSYHLPSEVVKRLSKYLPPEIQDRPVVESESKKPGLRSASDTPNSKDEQKEGAAVPARSSKGKIKLPLAGPRVKHVCRSASLVLGQSITATFDDKGSVDVEETSFAAAERDFSSDDSPGQALPSDLPANSDRQKYQRPVARTLQDLGRDNCELLDGMEKHELEKKFAKVAIDFWEAYDPEEVTLSGFPLISSNNLNVRALCFLCGSAGLEKLVHCSNCCEAYHTFCASSLKNDADKKEWWRLDWFCPKCTECRSCSKPGGTQLLCASCHASYHFNCVSSGRANVIDGTWMCPSCLNCSSCRDPAVHVFVGNVPLCKQCFKLRKKGNYCPLCQVCYDDNDYDTKMMECAECKKWIHAKCEKISDETYQILSYLPSSIEFVCRNCCKEPPPLWTQAVSAQLKVGLLNVIKALSKNKEVCNMLKASPMKKSCSCRNYLPKPILLKNLSGPTETPVKPESDQVDDKCSDLGLLTPNLTKDDEECMESAKINLVNNKVIREGNPAVYEFREDADDLPVTRFEQTNSLNLLSIVGWANDRGVRKSQKSPVTDDSESDKKCSCETEPPSPPSIMEIKKKILSNNYATVKDFNRDMLKALEGIHQDSEVVYQSSLKHVFPWFDSKNPSESSFIEDNPEVAVDVGANPGAVADKPCSSVVSKPKEVDCSWKELLAHDPDYYYINSGPPDLRTCMFCKAIGEGQPSKEGRLLYCGYNEWVHLNCALWSSEVFEEIDGSLQNVHSAISRARMIRCFSCGKKGASVGCCARSCPSAYHLACALESNCVFLANKEVYCKTHGHVRGDKDLHDPNDFHVSRPIHVELDPKKRKEVLFSEVRVAIGSLLINMLGEIIPEDSDFTDVIVPCNYECSRWFWSAVEPWKLVRYFIATRFAAPCNDYCPENDINYTIDHALEFTPPPSPVDTVHSVKSLNDERDIRNLLTQMVDIVCTREDDSNLVDQQATDLLPPDIEEAIFEDLPHDILDGISMNDIFTKMTFDDFTECKMDKLDVDVDVQNFSKKVSSEKKDSYQMKSSGFQKSRRYDCPKELDKWKSGILQLDGAVDIDSSDNESMDSSFTVQCSTYIGESPVREDEPVKCDRCHRTYRSSIGYERHLPSCDTDFSCDSESSGDEDIQSAMKQDIGEEVHFVQAVEIINSRESSDEDSCTSQDGSSCDIQAQGVEMVVDVYEDCQTSENGTVEEVQDVQCADVQFADVQTSSPAIIVQQMPQEIMPQYVSSYTQPAIQQPELQYFSSPPPSNFHYQPVPLAQPVLPAVQPTIVGTIVQSGDQLVFNQPNSIDIYNPPPANGIYLANPPMQPMQPMLVGMETVVSNTVMSSSQFIAGVPGVMASSYSATTTQVFQTAKPQVEVPQNYVVVNAQPVQPMITPASVPGLVNNLQPAPWNNYHMNIQEYKVGNVGSSIQTVTRKVVHERKDVDGVKTINSTQETIVIEPAVHNNSMQQHYTCMTPAVDNVLREPIFEKTSFPELKPSQPKVVELPRMPTFKKEKPQQAVAPVVIKKLPSAVDKKEPAKVVTVKPEPPRYRQADKISSVCGRKCNDEYNASKFCGVDGSTQKAQETEGHCGIDEPKENVISDFAGINGTCNGSEVLSAVDEKSEDVPLLGGGEDCDKIPEQAEMSEQTEIVKDNVIVSKPVLPVQNGANGKTKKGNKKKQAKITWQIMSEDGFAFATSDVESAWQTVFEKVQEARKSRGLPVLSKNPFSGSDGLLKKALGLGNNGVKFMLEQLPGVSSCSKYRPAYHKKRLTALEVELSKKPKENYTGCARTEECQQDKHPYDMFSWLASRHRRPPKLTNCDNDVLNGNGRRATSMSLPMAMRFRHLKETSKMTVGVFRSDIHGRGLFALRDIDQQEMVIEYAGEVIRSSLTDKREKFYTAKGIGCYMFRIDDNTVVDATMKGNAARFINHSCEPNCYSKVVDILGKKHILIFALRKIAQGEELTYDYKFPLEEDKINCHCLSRKCRKYLN